MHKSFTLCCLFIFISAAAMAQQKTITGNVADTAEKRPVHNAVVALLAKSDSLLLTFGRTDQEGKFRLITDQPGPFILLVSCPKFADFVNDLDINDKAEHASGTIALTKTAQLLEEVVIRGQAIRIKGDTTEYIADSFYVREGATVEELLKKLPGFQVDAQGNITAQGQRVQKVLVDGEEFFGDDPTMATQNIGAKAVQKVQVFDGKSDQQKLTGIPSGNEGKTINIQLKEDRKRGAFGKAYAGTDFNRYVDAKALYNNFVGKRKISVYGSKSNVNTGSLDWRDRDRLGIEQDYEYDELTGIFTDNMDREFESWNVRGLPDSYTAGALYSNKWLQDRHGINGSYRYNRLRTENVGTTLTQNILQDSVTYTNNYDNTNSLIQQHAANARYEWKIDSLASLRVVSAGKFRTGENFSNARSEYLNEDGMAINNNERVNLFSQNGQQLDNQLTYTQLFRKKRRQLIANFRFGINDREQEGFLYAKTNFYENGTLVQDSITDQQKFVSTQARNYGAKITYSEPIGKNLNIIGVYGINKSDAVSSYNTFNLSTAGKYEIRDSLFSNNFDMQATSNSGSALLKYETSKLRFTAGSGISNINLNLLNKDNNLRYNYTFLNHTPVAYFSYRPKQQTSFEVRYNGNTTQPTIDQLQPLRNNNDPLNIFVGNPDLKVGFSHRINASYHSYKVLRSQFTSVYASYNVNNNAIVFSNSIDEKGRRVYSPVNVNGNNMFNFGGYYGLGQGNKKLRHFFNVNMSAGNNVAFINGVRSDNRFFNPSFNYSIGYEIQDKFSFNVRPEIAYNSSRSSIQTNVNNNFFSYGGRSDVFIMLPLKLELNMNVHANLRQRIAAFDQNLNIVLLNGNLARKVFKDKSGKIILEAFDILNQNRGYNRIINSNFVTDQYYSQISQYFMLKFEWSFTKMPGAQKP